METINKILCKTTDFVFGVAEFTGKAVGLLVTYTVLLAFAVAALLLWLSVPVVTCMELFSEMDQQWQAFSVLGIFAAWVVLSKLVYDRVKNRK